jgi:hypothetical protein
VINLEGLAVRVDPFHANGFGSHEWRGRREPRAVVKVRVPARVRSVGFALKLIRGSVDLTQAGLAGVGVGG